MIVSFHSVQAGHGVDTGKDQVAALLQRTAGSSRVFRVLNEAGWFCFKSTRSLSRAELVKATKQQDEGDFIATPGLACEDCLHEISRFGVSTI